MLPPYITHITLSTGHSRHSPRSEVSDDALSALAPWLDHAVISGQREPLPVPELSHFSAHVTNDQGLLLCTMYGPSGPHRASKPYAGDTIPIVTIGVAQSIRRGQELWALMRTQFGAADIQKPPEPWCAAAILPGITAYPGMAEWLGDFERCLAWAWITRNPQMTVVE